MALRAASEISTEPKPFGAESSFPIKPILAIGTE